MPWHFCMPINVLSPHWQRDPLCYPFVCTLSLTLPYGIPLDNQFVMMTSLLKIWPQTMTIMTLHMNTPHCIRAWSLLPVFFHFGLTIGNLVFDTMRGHLIMSSNHFAMTNGVDPANSNWLTIHPWPRLYLTTFHGPRPHNFFSTWIPVATNTPPWSRYIYLLFALTSSPLTLTGIDTLLIGIALSKISRGPHMTLKHFWKFWPSYRPDNKSNDARPTLCFDHNSSIIRDAPVWGLFGAGFYFYPFDLDNGWHHICRYWPHLSMIWTQKCCVPVMHTIPTQTKH